MCAQRVNRYSASACCNDHDDDIYYYNDVLHTVLYTYTIHLCIYNKTLYAYHHHHRRHNISYPPHVWSAAGLDVDVNGGSHNYVYIYIVRSRVIGLYYIDRPLYTIYIYMSIIYYIPIILLCSHIIAVAATVVTH